MLTRIRSLLQGEEAEVSLAVDVMMPIPTLTGILNAFSAAYPTVTMRLHVEAVGAVTSPVRDDVADLGVSNTHSCDRPISRAMTGARMLKA